MLPRSLRVSYLVCLTFFRAPRQDDSFAQKKLETSSTVAETCQTRHLCLANGVSTTLATSWTERRAETRGARGEEAASSTYCVWQWRTAIVYVASRIQRCTTKHHRQRRRRAGMSLAPQLLKCSLYFVFRLRDKTNRQTKRCRTTEFSEGDRNSWLEKHNNQVSNPLVARARKEKMLCEEIYFHC